MACNCKHNQEIITYNLETLENFRQLFIKRMTVDSEHNDRRRKDYNQAIFHYEDKESIDEWNNECEKYGLARKEYGRTYPVWSEIDMDMVLECFDNAVRDYRKSWCDVEDCSRK
jgi:hypothetical protein